MTGIRALSSTPYVQPTAAKPDGNVVSSAATANFPTVMRDHHQKLMASMESAKAGRPADRPEVLLSLSRRPDIEAMIERQHAARKASLCAKGSAVVRGDEDDAELCDERHEDPPAWRVDPCGNGLVHGAPVDCAHGPLAPPVAPGTSLVVWHPFETARTVTSTVRAQPRRRRRPASADQHRADQQQAEVDGDGA